MSIPSAPAPESAPESALGAKSAPESATSTALGPAGPPEAGGPRYARLRLAVTMLVVFTAVPAALLTVPNTISSVAVQAAGDLGLSDAQVAALVRANGLVLPALLLAVPFSAVAARRFSPWAVLLAGLSLVLAGELGATAADSVRLVGAVRIIEGLGAGTILPATVVLVWELRKRVLVAVWAGVFIAALMIAMPLALYSVSEPAGVSWRVALQPYPWLVGAALGVAGLYGLGRTRRQALPVLRHGERTQLLLPVVPATGFAFLAVVTTYGWSPDVQLIVAGLGLAGLLGLALVGSRDAATGSPLGCAVVMLTVGLVTMPVVAPLAGLVSVRGSALLLPTAAGAGCALLGALITSRAGRKLARAGVLAGHGLVLIAVPLLLTMGPASSRWLLTAPLAVLGAGTGVALGSALRGADVGAALLGLSLCFPAVLTGHLVIGSLQIAKVNVVLAGAGGADATLLALTGAFRSWLVITAVLVAIMAAASALVSRRRAEQRHAERRDPALAHDADPDEAALAR